MSSSAESENILELTGVLNMKTTMDALKKTKKFINNKPETTIDFSKVEYADSSTLALILHWQRQSKQQNTKLYLKNLPKQLTRIAKLSELDKILVTD